jgi:hypothetical protein
MNSKASCFTKNTGMFPVEMFAFDHAGRNKCQPYNGKGIVATEPDARIIARQN